MFRMILQERKKEVKAFGRKSKCTAIYLPSPTSDQNLSKHKSNISYSDLGVFIRISYAGRGGTFLE